MRGRRSALQTQAQIARQAQRFGNAGAAGVWQSHWRGCANWRTQISWKRSTFAKVECEFGGRRVAFTRSSAAFVAKRRSLGRSGMDFVAGAAPLQGQAQISWQAQRFRGQVGRRSAFARSGTQFQAEQGLAQVWWQAHRLCKVEHRFLDGQSAFARSTAWFMAGACACQKTEKSGGW